MNDDIEEFDVIVVGAGISGGLPAAAYLQKAGCSVAVIERDKDGAPFSSFYERPPGVRFDVTPVNFSIMSPAIADLDLATYGYRIKRSEILYSTLDGAGRSITFFADPVKLKEELARYSPADASAFLRVLRGLNDVSREVLSVAFFTPTPDRARAVALTAAAVGIEPFELETMSASALVERLFESDAVRVAVTALPAINLFGDLLSPGQGALAWLWTFLMRACTVSRDDPTLAQAVERAFLAHGGVLFKATTATRLVRDDNGRCCGVEIENNGARQVFRARHGVISDLGADLTSALVEKQPCGPSGVRPGGPYSRPMSFSTVLWHGRLKRSTARPASISSGRAGPIVSGGSGWRETNRKRCSLDTSSSRSSPIFTDARRMGAPRCACVSAPGRFSIRNGMRDASITRWPYASASMR